MKEFLAKKTPFLIFLPVLVVELLVFKKSIGNYYALRYSTSPSIQIALKNQTSSVLGINTDVFWSWGIEEILIGIIIFLVICLWILIFKTNFRGKNF